MNTPSVKELRTLPGVNEHTNKNVKTSPYVDYLGIEVIDFKENDVLVKLPIREELLNLYGSLHGGVHASMLDLVLAFTIMSTTKVDCKTINLSVNYFSPSNKGEVFARATILQQGYKIVTAEGEVFDEENKLLAKGTGTYKLVRK